LYCCTFTLQIADRILNRINERKNEDVLGDQSGFRRGKETRDETGKLRISERTLDMDENLCLLHRPAEGI
jgi:hypothetical protein